MIFPITVFLIKRLADNKHAGAAQILHPCLEIGPLGLEKKMGFTVCYLDGGALRAAIGDENGHRPEVYLAPWGRRTVGAVLIVLVKILRHQPICFAALIGPGALEMGLEFGIVVPELVIVAEEKIRAFAQSVLICRIAPVEIVTGGTNVERRALAETDGPILIKLIATE